ncbi:MAG: DUF1893 domain-containing protein [Clostridia bacterium]|nr:DUF1893 domain-containing protein [Clostridia bacterium]
MRKRLTSSLNWQKEYLQMLYLRDKMCGRASAALCSARGRKNMYIRHVSRRRG